MPTFLTHSFRFLSSSQSGDARDANDDEDDDRREGETERYAATRATYRFASCNVAVIDDKKSVK
jgi:hypothetical protein